MKRISDDSASSKAKGAAASAASSGHQEPSLGDIMNASSMSSQESSITALSRLAAASGAGASAELQRLLAQQQPAMSPSLSTLLAQQRMQQLQQHGSQFGNMNALALLQQQQQELLLAEQLQIQQQQNALNERLLSARSQFPGGGGTPTSQQQHSALLSMLAAQQTGGAGLFDSQFIPGLNGGPFQDGKGKVSTDDIGKISARSTSPRGKSGEPKEEPSGGGDDSKMTGDKEPSKEAAGEDHVEDEEEDDDSKADDDNNDTFPFKLYRMIAEAERDGKDSIISFNSKGKCFMIHKPREFVTEIMPKYFTTSRMSSFQRQLNLYGFRRISEGPDKGGYVHENFLKGKKSLCKKIKRKKPSMKLPPPGLSYMNPSLLSGSVNPALSVRQLIADGQLSDTGLQQYSHQQSSFAGLAGLSGFGAGMGMGAGGAPSSSLAALLLEQQQQQQRQQASALQQMILRQQQERELKLLELQRRQQQDQDQNNRS